MPPRHRECFIPAKVGTSVSDTGWRILAHPAGFGGLGIQNPVETSDNEYNNSIKITKDLTNLIYLQEQPLDKLDKDNISKCKKVWGMIKPHV